MHKQKERVKAFYELHDTDPTLDDFEYYVKVVNPQTGKERIYKAYVMGISFQMHDGRHIYQLACGGKILHSQNYPYDEWWHKSEMYDNKEDCKNEAHWGCDDWEEDD